MEMGAICSRIHHGASLGGKRSVLPSGKSFHLTTAINKLLSAVELAIRLKEVNKNRLYLHSIINQEKIKGGI